MTVVASLWSSFSGLEWTIIKHNSIWSPATTQPCALIYSLLWYVFHIQAYVSPKSQESAILTDMKPKLQPRTLIKLFHTSVDFKRYNIWDINLLPSLFIIFSLIFCGVVRSLLSYYFQTSLFARHKTGVLYNVLNVLNKNFALGPQLRMASCLHLKSFKYSPTTHLTIEVITKSSQRLYVFKIDGIER